MLRRSFLITTLIFTSIIFSQSVNAIAPYYDGMMDPTFVNGQVRGPSDYIGEVVMTEDNKIYVGGRFELYDGYKVGKGLIRINYDGSLDQSFNTGTGLSSGEDSFIDSMVLLDDGKILIVGEFLYEYNGIPIGGIARINPDGSLDTTFNEGGIGFPQLGWDGYPYDIKVQQDGKIIVVGGFTSYNGVTANRIVRLNSDGTLDSSFNPGTGANEWIYTVLLLNDGKYLIGGYFTSYNGTARNRIARINPDGSLDTTFNPGTGLNNSVEIIKFQNDGKILIGGSFTSYNGTTRSKILRLNSDLSLDTSFIPGTFTTQYSSWGVYTIVIQDDGNILVSGNFTAYNGIPIEDFLRLTPTGAIDPSFILPSGNTDNRMYQIIQDNSNKLLIAGAFSNYQGTDISFLSRLNNDGSFDGSFLTGRSGIGWHVVDIDKDNNGKFIITGYFNTYNGNNHKLMVRFNSDMSVDNEFDIGTGPNRSIEDTYIQSDGKIMIGGQFTNFNGQAINKIARLNPDGSIDPTFNPGSGPNYYIYAIQPLPDGKYLIGGWFTTYDGVSKNHFARLNSDGSLDSSFNTGTGPNSNVSSIALLNDGKILIGGNFTTFNGVSRNRIARLNSDGSLDATFDVGTGSNASVYAFEIQPDNKTIIGGSFTTYNGTNIYGLARINNDGSLDTTFNAGTDYWIYSIALQDDGKILAGGWFTTTVGLIRSNLIRLNSDGTPDSTFGSIVGPNGYVNKVLIDDEKVYIGGVFAGYDNTPTAYFTRLLNDQHAPTGSISINSASAFTQSTSVILTLNAEDNISGVKDMMVCSNSSFEGCSWESYTGSKSWVFDSSLGIKTVYVKYRDNEGNESEVYSDTISLHRIVITDIGLIDDIPDQDRLWYYFTSTTPVIQGYTQANSTVYFKNGSKTYTVTADSNGDFKTTLYLGNGTTTLSYYSIDPYGNQTETRTLILIIGTEYFPDWLLIKLGLLPAEEEGEVIEEEIVEEEEEEEDIVIPEIEEETKTAIQIIGFDGDPIRDTEVIFDGVSYITDGEGYIYVIDVEAGSHIVKLKINEEEYSQLLVLGENDLEGGSIVRFENENDYSIYVIVGCISLILMTSVSMIIYKRRGINKG